jgi:hypothetical protein
MRITAVKEIVQAQPFRPFVTHVGGRDIEVTHPEQVLFAADESTVVIATPDGHIHLLDVNHIDGIERRGGRRKAA